MSEEYDYQDDHDGQLHYYHNEAFSTSTDSNQPSILQGYNAGQRTRASDFETNPASQISHGTSSGPKIPESEPTKHRRSRNGCFTCRNRRVKCDETRPSCNRCRRGCRDCVYPELAITRTSRVTSKTSGIPEEDSFEDLGTPPLTDSKSISPATTQGSSFISYNTLHPGLNQLQRGTSSGSFDVSGAEKNTSLSPLSLTSGESSQRHPRKSPEGESSAGRKVSELDPTLRFFLDYRRKNVTHHEYGLIYDGCGFLHRYLIDQALTDDALLYAVVSFAAYHYTIRKPDGVLQDFLGFYSRSLRLLRHTLQRGRDHSIATLLTILQLALLEEFLGDWVNLISHQKAAYTILTEMFTPQTIVQDRMLNKILEWYIRFDLFAGFIAGRETVLSREWFETQHHYYVQQVHEHPEDLEVKFEERHCCARLLATDVAILFGKKGKSAIGEDEFNAEAEKYGSRFFTWYQDTDTMFYDPASIIRDLPEPSFASVDGDDLLQDIDMYGGDLWTTNFLTLHFLPLELMFKQQLALMQNKTPPRDLVTTPLKIAYIFEAIERLHRTPGSIVSAQGALAIASIYLPKDEQHTMWCRRKLAMIESMGYIYPSAFRKRMSDAWGVDVTRWWLPNDQGYPPIVRSIREFIDYRMTPAKDRHTEDLREIAGIFKSLKLDDSPRGASDD